MTHHVNHIKDLPELNQDLQKLVSDSEIAWSKTKEEIWAEMQAKIEDKDTAVKNPRTIPLKLVRYAAAAVLVLLVGFAAAMNLYTKTIENRPGEEKGISLPDRSGVRLYGESALSYKPLGWMFSRSVRLEGEGSFEVQKGNNFEVISPKGKVVVLGTRFRVYSRGEAYYVICESGKVEVIEAAHKHKVKITAGQKASLKTNGKFEVIHTTGSELRIRKKTRDQIINEELNHILSTPPEHLKVQSNEAGNARKDKQTHTMLPKAEKIQDRTAEPAGVEQPTQVPVQEGEHIREKKQAKEQVKTQAGNKEQEQNANGEAKQNPHQDRFRASLTPEQISILEDKHKSREQIRKAFLESLSPEQLQLLQEQNAERARQAEGNSNGEQPDENQKEQQKTQLREQSRERTDPQNKEMLRQHLQENKDDLKPDERGNQGSGKGPGM